MDTVLQDFGLVPFFANQLSVEDLESGRAGRVIEVQRSLITISNGSEERAVPLAASFYKASAENRPTVGDWVTLNDQQSEIERVLNRKTVVRRVAAGEKAEIQLVAANIDILFIVTSCNEEFKESRLERYLALATEAGVTPVVVLTKIDVSDDPISYAERARQIQAGVSVESINALDKATFDGLTAWIEPGSTIALVGSSGVGKSTLLNALMGVNIAATSKIRAQDDKGRHTTSHRALYRLPGGGFLIDMPGMRELKVAEIDEALDAVFDEIESLASRCRFADCGHESEPGCAVRKAVEDGELDERRLSNYLKLLNESERHNSSLAEVRSKGRDFSRHVKQAIAWKKGSEAEQ